MRRVLLVAATVLALVAAMAAPASGQEVAPVPTIAVTPSTDLVDGQVGTVAGDGWLPHEEVSLIVCTVGPVRCALPSETVTTDGAGAFSAPFRLRAHGYWWPFGELDCRAQECALHASQGSVVAVAALAFDPAAPTLPAPTLEVLPNADLRGGQEVTVEGAGYFPGEVLSFGQCPTREYRHPGNCEDGTVTADGVGEVHFTAVIQGEVVNRAGGGNVRTIDCRLSQCYLGVASAYSSDYYTRASTPLHLRGDADEHLEVRPSNGLVDGEQVAIDATGLNPNEEVFLAQCVVGDVGDFNIPFGQCVTAPTRLQVDPFGELHTALAVRSAYRSDDGGPSESFDCLLDPCQVILEGEGVGYTVLNDTPVSWVGAPLSFAGEAASQPAPPVAATPAFTG